MTPTQREAALRLAEYQEKLAFAVQAGGDSSGFDLMDTAALLRELAVVPKSAIEQFNETEGVDAMSPLERLRFFCSLSMTPQDWLDVEPFFDALAAEPQGEPVAWHVCSVNSDGSLSLEFAAPWEELAHEHVNDAINEHDIDGAASWVVRPVYASPQPQQTEPSQNTHPPQQRKPLTDEQVWNLVGAKLDDSMVKLKDVLPIARAIERAHGIGD